MLLVLGKNVNEIRQIRNKLNMFSLIRLFQKDGISFDIVAKPGNIVAKNGNNVEATTKFYDELVCHFWQQSQMLLR